MASSEYNFGDCSQENHIEIFIRGRKAGEFNQEEETIRIKMIHTQLQEVFGNVIYPDFDNLQIEHFLVNILLPEFKLPFKTSRVDYAEVINGEKLGLHINDFMNMLFSEKYGEIIYTLEMADNNYQLTEVERNNFELPENSWGLQFKDCEEKFNEGYFIVGNQQAINNFYHVYDNAEAIMEQINAKNDPSNHRCKYNKVSVVSLKNLDERIIVQKSGHPRIRKETG